MNIKAQSPLSKIVFITVLAFLAVSCQPNPLPTQNSNGNDIQDIRVQAVEPTRTTSKVEQFPLPNCGGSDKLAQSLGTFASVSKSATVGAKATVTGGGEVAIPETAKLKLEIQVEVAYQQTFESANSRLDTIVMSAAAGTHVVYTIVWEEQTFNSIVQFSSDGKVYEVPYTYVLSVPKIDKSYNVVCDVTSPGNNSSGNITAIPPTFTTPPTIIPTAPLPNQPQCSHFQVASPTQTMVAVPVGMWEVTRKCSPAQTACFYTMEQSSGGQYLSYEHQGTADRYWVNAFCTEAEAKNFANTDAKAMLEWWQYTEQNPFP